ncbi:MAG: uncharacterized protein PWP16_1711 [Eubacteriaceae bacterium]|nr:uncharacterized protein [Eubacteriaceae bacterium]MDK2905491.1 uncharacterized protein [Eubacteriaceae bacterium]MDK2936457.1 uncharacterized protein [Eubacteriaceae bacterium]MDK2961559.1 uncharacterized protein [Eubacteriaceae bacterium]MDN5308348.1 uncharacterized protein [Eubacteriaceae bacterium]
MIIGSMTLRIDVPWVHSLKEKRQIVKSLIAKGRQKFNISLAEVSAQDYHQSIVLGMACVTNETRVADRTMEQVLKFMEENSEGEVFVLVREFR